MEFKDYYEVMGVARDASQDEIKRAYRRLARKYHPDVSKERDAEARFKQLGEAYEVLKDPEKRGAYDQLGRQWKSGEDFRPPPDWDQNFEFHGGGFSDADASEFSDFFESLFGRQGGFRSTRAGAGHSGFSARGNDSHAKILIDLEDAYQGKQRSVTLKHSEVGADGRPKLKERVLNVRIPRGVSQGQHIRLANQGGTGIGGGQNGDLYLEIEFMRHKHFRVEGKDVYLDLPIAPWEAALGGRIKVPTPAGMVDMTIPAESSSGDRLRLKGRGIPAKTPGDLYVELQIVLPKALSESAKEFYREYEKKFAFNPRSELGV